jgi:hypothetical protein
MKKESEIIADIRQAVADYMASEGCGCCQNVDKHEDAAKRLAKLLGVKMYADKSGYDFNKYKTAK